MQGKRWRAGSGLLALALLSGGCSLWESVWGPAAAPSPPPVAQVGEREPPAEPTPRPLPENPLVRTELIFSPVWQQLPPVAAIVEGEAISREEFLTALMRDLVHQVMLQKFILDRLLDFEAEAQQVQVSAAEVEGRLAEIEAEVARSSSDGRLRLADLLRGWGLSRAEYREEVRRELVQVQLARRLVGLPAGQPLTEPWRLALVNHLLRLYEPHLLLTREQVSAAAPPGVVMVLNQQPVTREEYARYLLRQLPLAKAGEILDDLILWKLVELRLAAIGRQVTPRQVDAAWAALLRDQVDDLGPETRLVVQRLGPEAGREMLRQILGLDRLAGAPTEAELLAFFDRNRTIYGQGRRRARHLLCAAFDEQGRPRGADPDSAFRAAEERARGYLAELQAEPARFEALASRADVNDDGPTRETGGDLGFFLLREPKYEPFQPLLDQAFAATRNGENWPLELVRTRFGWHVLQVLEEVPPQPVEFERCRKRVLQDVMLDRRRQKVQELRAEARPPQVERPLLDVLRRLRQAYLAEE